MCTHAAAACVHAVPGGCERCAAFGLQPSAAPYASLRPNSIAAAAALYRAQSFIFSHGGGNVQSPSLLFAASLRLAPPSVLLAGCRASTDASTTNWAAVQHAERVRKQALLGAPPPLPASRGGPATSLGRSLEQLCSLMLSTRDERRPPLSPILSLNVTAATGVSILITNAAALRIGGFLAAHGAPAFGDATGKLMSVKEGVALAHFMSMSAPGGGVLIFACALLQRNTETSILEAMSPVFTRYKAQFGDSLTFRAFVLDGDRAFGNAMCRIQNGCDLKAYCRIAEELLDDSESLLESKGLRGVDITDQNYDFTLPFIGFNVKPGLPSQRTLFSGLMLFNMCHAHGLKDVHDLAIYGARFKSLPVKRKKYWQWVLVKVLRFWLKQPLFAGPWNWWLTKEYLNFIKLLFTLPEKVPVGTNLAASVGPHSCLVVRAATPADARPGMAVPAFVLVASFKDQEVLTIRIKQPEQRGEEAGVEEAVELLSDADIDKTIAELSSLEDASADAAAVEAREAAEEAEAEAEAEADEPEVAAGASLALNPLHFSAVVRGKTVTPLSAVVRRWRGVAVMLSPAPRTEVPDLLKQGSTNAVAEDANRIQKYVAAAGPTEPQRKRLLSLKRAFERERRVASAPAPAPRRSCHTWLELSQRRQSSLPEAG